MEQRSNKLLEFFKADSTLSSGSFGSLDLYDMRSLKSWVVTGQASTSRMAGKLVHPSNGYPAQ